MVANKNTQTEVTVDDVEQPENPSQAYTISTQDQGKSILPACAMNQTVTSNQLISSSQAVLKGALAGASFHGLVTVNFNVKTNE